MSYLQYGYIWDGWTANGGTVSHDTSFSLICVPPFPLSLLISPLPFYSSLFSSLP